MRIMIVDDEVIIRTGLAKVIQWDELGLELLEPAASAEEAIRRIPEERPNILLTDIQMTGKTGLQLAEEAKGVIPDLEVIILSGYDDFAYTQQAIRQDVSDYLLKTSRPEDIIKTVLRAKQRIEEKWAVHNQDRRKHQDARSRLMERWVVEGDGEAASEALLRPYFPRLFEGSGTAEADGPAGADTAGGWQLLLASAVGWHDSPASEALLLFAAENMLGDLLPCETMQQQKRIVIALRAERDEEQHRCRLRSSVQKLERLLGCSMFVAAGTIVEQPELLHESYAAADRAFGYRLLTCESIWNYADIALRKGGRSVCSQEEELALSAILLDNNPLQLSSWVKERIQAQLDDPQTTIESLRAYMQSIAISAHRWLERALEATGQAPSAALDGDRASPAAQSGVSLRDALFQRLHAVMQLYHTQLAGGQAAHVQRAMAYIEQHIGGDVGLQHVAKHVHLHPNHLSEVFKKEAGTTFGDYVTKLKMKRAMEILTGTPAKVSEVAAQVGYEDVKYFSQLFKKTTGRTPSEFRGESARHEES